MTIQCTISTALRGLALAALCAVGAALWLDESAQCQPGSQPETATPEQPQGVEVLARGPVHEAYAEPAGGQAKAAPVVPKKPPEPIEEMPPDQKPDGDNIQWLPGYWSFDEEKGDYMWVSGFWRAPPPGRQWVPGHWNQIETGWQWVPGFWGAVEQKEVTYLPPPPPPIEAGPTVPASDPDHVYVPGCWVYRDGRYVWRPGYWSGCRRGWVWVPSHYVWTPCGYVFVEGYWDYTLRDRGLLFAPVYVDVNVCYRPGWCYSPCYVVHDECLFSAMFVRPGYHCYYFGDYFEPCHREAGYVAWCDVRIGGCYGDPLFSYYSVHYRSDPGWSVSIQATYVGCYAGTIARPPRTLIQQNTVVQNITVNNINNTTIVNNTNNINNTTINKNVNVNNNVRNTTMLSSLSQASKNGVAMKPVAPQERVAAKTAAQQIVQASQQRVVQEKQLLAQGPPPMKSTDAPRVAKLDLPKQPAISNATHSAAVKTPPPAPSDARAAKVDPGLHPTAAKGTPQPGNPTSQQNHVAGQSTAPAAGQPNATGQGTRVPPPPGNLHPDVKGTPTPTNADKKGPPPKTVPPPSKPAPPDKKTDHKKDKDHN
jgi:hypothetical protein